MLRPGSLTVDKQNYTSPQEFNCVIMILNKLLGINWGLPETKWFGWVVHWLTDSLSILGVGGLDKLRVSLSQCLVLFSHSSPSVFMDKSMGKFLVYYILAYYRTCHYIFSHNRLTALHSDHRLWGSTIYKQLSALKSYIQQPWQWQDFCNVFHL